MRDAILVFFARRLHERLKIITTAICDSVFHTYNRYAWVFFVIGTIILLHNTGVYKLTKSQMLVYHDTKVVISIKITK